MLYDWNIETGAIAFADRIDEMLGLPAGGFPRSIEGWLERIHLDDHDATMEALSQSILGGARSTASTACAAGTAPGRPSPTRASC